MSKNNSFEEELKEREPGRDKVKIASIGIVLIVLVGFIIITYCTGLIGQYFGKLGENISLGLIGLVLIYALYITDRRKK